MKSTTITIKALNLLGYIYLVFLIVVFLLIVGISIYGPETSPAILAGFYEGVMGSSASLNTYQIGYLIGTMVLPATAVVIMLMSIRKKSAKLWKSALFLCILLFLGGLGQGRFPLTMLIFSILLLLKPTKNYFADGLQAASQSTR